MMVVVLENLTRLGLNFGKYYVPRYSDRRILFTLEYHLRFFIKCYSFNPFKSMLAERSSALGSFRMKKCPSCGFENGDENNFCAKRGESLGSALQTTPRPITTYQPAKRVHHGSGAIVGGVLLFVVIIALIMAWSTMLSAPGVSSAAYTIKIDSNTSWSGAMGGLSGPTTRDGSGSALFKIQSSLASACLQKQTEEGYLTVTILRNGQVVEHQTTTAAYGVVTVSG
jgi:hypothetical protein